MKRTNQTIILTTMGGLCRFMQKDNIDVVKMTPIKGIDGEDIMKVEYCYKEKEA